MRIILGITGSSGAVFSVEFLKRCPGDKFLVVSKWGKVLLREEMNLGEKDLQPYVKRQFQNDDLTAPLASGSNQFDALRVRVRGTFFTSSLLYVYVTTHENPFFQSRT